MESGHKEESGTLRRGENHLSREERLLLNTFVTWPGVRSRDQELPVPVPALPLTHCMTLDQFLGLFPLLYKKNCWTRDPPRARLLLMVMAITLVMVVTVIIMEVMMMVIDNSNCHH